jgi:hypothetical protein
MNFVEMKPIPPQEMRKKTYLHAKGACGQSKEPRPKSFQKNLHEGCIERSMVMPKDR